MYLFLKERLNPLSFMQEAFRFIRFSNAFPERDGKERFTFIFVMFHMNTRKIPRNNLK